MNARPASNDSPPPSHRRAVRRAAEAPCEIVWSHDDTPLAYRAHDLSTSGMWIATSAPLRTGETVVVCFEAGGPFGASAPMVFAEVARVATSRRATDDPSVGMGLEFLDLDDDDANALRRFLSRQPDLSARRRGRAAA